MVAFLFLLLAGPASAALPPAETINQMFEDYSARRFLRPLREGTSMEDALAVQRIFIKELQPALGRPVGWKVGLVNRESQHRFGVTQPVRGVLLEKMILTNHAEVSTNFGASLLLEADLIVTVKDKGINKAGTHLEALKHLKEVVAFIELPDSIFAPGAPADGAALAAANVGARLGVIGTRVPVRANQAFADALASMTVVLTDEAGLEMGRAQGKVILDHPLNALLWLIEDLSHSGQSLQPGDLISLGSIRAMPLPPAKSVTATYDGLPGGPMKVTVRIKP